MDQRSVDRPGGLLVFRLTKRDPTPRLTPNPSHKARVSPALRSDNFGPILPFALSLSKPVLSGWLGQPAEGGSFSLPKKKRCFDKLITNGVGYGSG
jgi:hypothetical protein